MYTQRQNLLNFDLPMLINYLTTISGSKTHAKYLFKAIHVQQLTNTDDCWQIPKALRHILQKQTIIEAPTLVAEKVCQDGTIKWHLRLKDNNQIETVYIPENSRNTLCISSQVGCILNCQFCATGKQGYSRNLEVNEILGQVWFARQRLKSLQTITKYTAKDISNVVFMGMGEPLLNLPAVITTIKALTCSYYSLSKRKITVSTAGIVPMIYELANSIDVSLAISLHAPNDKIRSQIMPINKKYPLAKLLKACEYYLELYPKNTITMEYIMLDGINDNIDNAIELVTVLEPISSRIKINLIPFNKFVGTSFTVSEEKQILSFKKILDNSGIITTIRKTRGDNIAAACGQLVGQVTDRTKRQIHWQRKLQAQLNYKEAHNDL